MVVGLTAVVTLAVALPAQARAADATPPAAAGPGVVRAVADGEELAEQALDEALAVVTPEAEPSEPRSVPTVEPTEPTETATPGATAAAGTQTPGEEGTAWQPEVAIGTSTERGSVNVSVRVDSPGEDGPVAQTGRSGAVVSAADTGDTTGSATVGAEPTPQPTTSTNVSVRAGSPGDDGPVQQAASRPPATTAVASAPAREEAGDSEQYHEENFQYHSREPAEKAPSDTSWNWVWRLDICEENVSSISLVEGDATAASWIWSWSWNWDCTRTPTEGEQAGVDDGASGTGAGGQPATGGAARERAPNVNVSVRVASPGDNGAVAQESAAGDEDVTEGGSWVWTWVFTACGRTTVVATTLEVAAALDWLWDWTWSRSCPTPSSPPSSGDTAGDTAPPQPPAPPVAAASPAASAAVTLPLSLPVPGAPVVVAVLDGLEVDVGDVVPLAAELVQALPAESSLVPSGERRPPCSPSVVVVPAALVPATAPLPLLRSAARAAPIAATRGGVARAGGASASGEGEPEEAALPVRTRRPPTGRAHQPPRPDAPPPPRLPGRQLAAASSTTAGAPGAGVASGLAIFTPLCALSAPGPGRRARPSPVPRPRGRLGTRLDRPG